MKHQYSFHPNLILRTPAQAFSTDFDAATILAALDDAQFAEALYLASPGLYEECRKWQAGTLRDAKKVAKLCATLTRYYTRMRSRCTPFGLFAGCSVISWGAQSRVQLDAARNTRHTRLDMHYLCTLARQLAHKDSIRPHLRYWPQTSLYQLGAELRYVEYYYADGQRVHQLSSVEATPVLLQLLAAARRGLTESELANVLVAEEAVGPTEAALFVQTLVEAQLLVSELEPTVTGPEFFAHLRAVLARLHAAAPSAEIAAAKELLDAVAQQLDALDGQAANPSASYARIAAALQALEVPIEPDKLFQTDLICGVAETDATLDEALQETLLEAVEALTHLGRPTRNKRLENFKQRFQQRYEEQEVPLLEALDTESGLAYSDYGKHSYSPLVHDLHLTETTDAAAQQQDEVQRFLAAKLREADQQRRYAVDLVPAEISALPPLAASLPPSFSLLFRVVGERQILLDSVGGSSAVNLLGRFAHASPRLETIVREVTAQEQEQNPAVVFAEICHLPMSRVGNILLRPAFRALEIPYLAQSSLPVDQQVAVQDLLLSVRQGQLVLRSRRTGHRIMPRLSTAHNFSNQALPIYEFLCDLQTQGLQAQLGVSWEATAPERKFYPRLTYQQVVLQAAAWHLAAADYRELLAAPAAEQDARFQAFRAQWQLPRFFTLADGDNELLIDADNELLRQVWLDTIRQRSSIKLKEFLFDPAASPVRDAQQRPHTQQLLALLVRNAPSYPAAAAAPAASSQDVRREFALGSEWLYYKWYCGSQMANRVLREVLAPLTQELQARQLIDKWFFIRYADPDTHLRVRFHLPALEHLGEVLQLVNEYLAPCLHARYIWKSQTDTYRRELERYGRGNIALTESLFHYQSAALLQQLEQLVEADENAYWQWGLHAVDELLEAFAVPLELKVALLRELRDSFGREFNLDKALKSQLDAKYRQFRPLIEQLLVPAAPVPEALRQLATAMRQQWREAEGQELPARLLGSYIHMLLNRLIPAQARLHELVLYDFLSRHYQSCQVRQQQQALVN